MAQNPATVTGVKLSIVALFPIVTGTVQLVVVPWRQDALPKRCSKIENAWPVGWSELSADWTRRREALFTSVAVQKAGV